MQPFLQFVSARRGVGQFAAITIGYSWSEVRGGPRFRAVDPQLMIFRVMIARRLLREAFPGRSLSDWLVSEIKRNPHGV